MANHLKIIGDCYQKFNITNTSVSAAKNPPHIRCFQKHYLTKEQNSKCANASLTLGTIGHDVVEKAIVENLTVEECIQDKKIQDKINSYISFDKKDQMKFEFGIKNLEAMANNHILNLKELPKQKWKTEAEHMKWIDPINVPFRMFIDLTGETHVNDIKYKNPTVKFSPLKTKQTKDNPNRIGDWVCSHPKIDQRAFTSDLMQIALYSHTTGLKPSLSYASATDRILFTEDNCEELKPKNLKMWLQELIAYEIAWEKKLKAADGSLEELMWLCVPDFSDIRKKSFWYQGVPEEYIKGYLNFYV
jgi:hypothetical protein